MNIFVTLIWDIVTGHRHHKTLQVCLLFHAALPEAGSDRAAGFSVKPFQFEKSLADSCVQLSSPFISPGITQHAPARQTTSSTLHFTSLRSSSRGHRHVLPPPIATKKQSRKTTLRGTSTSCSCMSWQDKRQRQTSGCSSLEATQLAAKMSRLGDSNSDHMASLSCTFLCSSANAPRRKSQDTTCCPASLDSLVAPALELLQTCP